MKTLSYLESRARDAYNRAGTKVIRELGAGSILQPGAIETVEHDGLTYIRLTNVNGILAVYRVRTVNGEPVLKRLKRWPKAIED